MSKKGYYGEFGGQFVPEFLFSALEELEIAFQKAVKNNNFIKEYQRLLCTFAGRPTALYFAKNISKYLGCKVYFKREDLLNGGSHKINNSLGQALLVKFMGKKKIITETAAGMHGVATTMAANVVGLSSEVFMGVKDIERQKLNVEKIRLLGGKVRSVTRGSGILKDAVSEALVAWIRNLPTTHYLVGSAVGPHPFPEIVAYFQKVIGEEAKAQILKVEHKLPGAIIACGSGGSNAIGIFQEFLDDKSVELIFVEGGPSDNPKRGSTSLGEHAAAFSYGSVGIFQGAKTYVLQDKYGMDRKTKSRAAGLNYPARGPQLAHLYKQGRIKAFYASDKEVLEAYLFIAKTEGLLAAFETCHAISYLLTLKGKYTKKDIVILNFSGRGDKDVDVAIRLQQTQSSNVKTQNYNLKFKSF